MYGQASPSPLAERQNSLIGRFPLFSEEMAQVLKGLLAFMMARLTKSLAHFPTSRSMSWLRWIMNESPRHQGSLLFITPHWKSNDKLSEQKEWPSVSCLSGKGYRKDGNCLQLRLFKDILTLKILYCLFLMAFLPSVPQVTEVPQLKMQLPNGNGLREQQ